MQLEEKGAYIFDTPDKGIGLFLYSWGTPQQLQNALPFSYQEDPTKSYIISLIVNGYDHVNQMGEQDVHKTIIYMKMKNIIWNSYEELLTQFPDLSRGQYQQYYDISIQNVNPSSSEP